MLTKIYSATNYGLKPIEIEIEVNIAEKGFPGFSVVGLSNKTTEESKERIKTAIINSGIEFPNAKITVNLAPADLPKEGSCYDLPIAIGIITAMGEIVESKNKSYYYGELALDGGLRHTKGVFLLALLAKEEGIKNLFVPNQSANEALVIEDINIYPVINLKQLISHLNDSNKIEKLTKIENINEQTKDCFEFEISEILGQESAKRALEIAAAGGHNVLMTGPPGSGKTMLAKSIISILPDLNDRESLEVTKIYSITGNIPAGSTLIKKRPFRSPHYTTSQVGLIGGGSNLRPGEISLSHRGVLFLDEMPEIGRGGIEALRQPMEDGNVTISRASGTVTFPAQFMLIAAANPCPCGFLGDPKNECKCSQIQINNYQKKLSGPILDRIDIHLTVPAVDVNKLIIGENKIKSESSKDVKKRVLKARELQKNRFAKTRSVMSNSDMKNSHLKEFANLSNEANLLLKQAINKFSISARTYFRLVKVARTIADLAGSENIEQVHIAEALQYRMIK